MPSDDKKRGCCGKDEDDEGCCDEDCCNRTCCNGRITCSLEAGFAATFALLSFAAMMYANMTCEYVQVRGNKYNEEGGSVAGGYNSSYVVASVDRGIFYGESVPGAACLSWLSLQRAGRGFVAIDPWWYASMGCAVAAGAFGFAAMVQIFFLSCVPRAAQRYMARCSSFTSVLAAALEGCTLLYLNGRAVHDAQFPDHDVDYTTFTLYISAWCAVGSCGGWFITAFILCFLKNPDDGAAAADDRAETSDKIGESSHRSSRRGSTRERDEENGDGGEEEEAAAQEKAAEPAPEEAAAAAAATAAAGAGAGALKRADSSEEAELWEDALMGSAQVHHQAAAKQDDFETPFSSEHGSSVAESPAWDYRKSADDFIDG